MRIPEIRAEIAALARILTEAGDIVRNASARLDNLNEELKRRPVERRASPKLRMNDAVAERVREYAASNPRASQLEIARQFNINPGRVSEALRGKRT